MIEWIRNFFNKKPSSAESFVRWSPEEIARKKHYLETSDPKSFTIDDWMMVSDYLVQRYWPKDKVVDVEKLRTNRVAMQKRVRKHLPEIQAAAVANIEAKNSPKPRIEPARYHLTREDFDIDILPNLCKFSFVPPHKNLDWRGNPLANSYWLLSSSHYPDIRAAKDVCIGKCDDFSIMHVSSALRHHYEMLRNAQIEDYEFVKISSSSRACPECKKLDGEKFRIMDLLAKFRDASIGFPHELSYEEEYDTPNWCDGIMFFTVIKPNPGVDPKFAAWLEANMKPMPD